MDLHEQFAAIRSGYLSAIPQPAPRLAAAVVAADERPEPILCERCGMHEVATPGEFCGVCTAEIDTWNWEAWADTHLGPAQ